jgi:thymidine phosphorylase
MCAVDIIRAKRDGAALGRPAIDAFVTGVLDGTWADYQTSALLMAIVIRGMTAEETSQLTDAMVRSGRRMDLSVLGRPTVGKHSTGGVGDKVSVVLAPAVAACGVIMPKMSGRGLGHTGGTLDKLESIPGFRVGLSPDEFVATLRAVGCAIVGQTADIAPADKVLYALRDVTATVESVPLISASVMSKKLAEGSQALVLDVKCGRGAFMKTRDEALALARSLVAIGTAHGVRTEAFVTAMDGPPADLRALVETLGGRALQLAGRVTGDADGRAEIRKAIADGRALATLRAMVAAQGGDPAAIDDPSRLPRAREVATVSAPSDGTLAAVDAELVGRAAVLLGAGRDRAGDPVDHAAGIRLRVSAGDSVRAGDPLADLHYNSDDRLVEAQALCLSAMTYGAPPPPTPLVRAWVHRGGETLDP